MWHTIETAMDVTKMISELRAERELLEEAMLALQRLAQGRSRRRGRPPKWLSDSRPDSQETGRRRFSAETRRRMAEAQKKRWAAKRAEAR